MLNRERTNSNNNQNIGWKPPVPPSEKKPTRNRRPYLRQIPVECDIVETRLSNLPTYTQEIWSKFGVIPSIRATKVHGHVDTQLRPDRNVTGKTDEEISYSKIRAEWMKMRRSGDLPQTIKDELHERYLQETTNYMNLLVFGVPDPGISSVTSESEIPGPQDADPVLYSGFVPKPPPGPRGSSDSRHRRLRRGRSDVKPMEILSPVSEGPSPRAV